MIFDYINAYGFLSLVPSGAPRQLEVKVLNSSAIAVSWQPPRSNQDGLILGYTVFYNKVDDRGNPLKPPAQNQMMDSMSENILVRDFA